MSEKRSEFPRSFLNPGADPDLVEREERAELRARSARPRKAARARRRERIEDETDEDDEKIKVVKLSLPPMPKIDRAGESRRRSWLRRSAMLCIALPTLFASLYFAFIAADQYAAEARFAVRSNDMQAADVLGAFAGLPNTMIGSDSYILADYMRSREMVEALQARIPLREIYSRDTADFLTRLDPTVGIEELVKYWSRRISPTYDATKNTITVEVRAFTPEDAATVANAIVEVSRDLINSLSQQARTDAVTFAHSEVTRAEDRVRQVRAEMLTFRTENNELDPTQSAAATLAIAAQLDAERSRLKSQLAAISTYLSNDAPSVEMLRSRIAALDDEAANVQGSVSASSESGGIKNAAMATVVGKYQELFLNQEFAEKAYAASLASLERARVEADRQQSYLAIYVHPAVPEKALYPRAIINTLAIFLIAALAWALGALSFLTVRDHVA